MSGLLAILREGDVSPAVRRAYIRRMRRAQRAIGRLEDGARRELLRDLEQARRAIQSALVDATQFGQWHLPQVLRAVEEALQQFRDTGSKHIVDTVNKAWELGDARVSSLAQEVGLDVNVPAFRFGIPTEQLEFSRGWAADLIQAEADDVIKAVSKEVRLAFAGGQTREQLIQAVQSRITKPLRFRTFRRRAETIVRTEVNRVAEAAAQARREKLGAENVRVRKQWLASGKGAARERQNHAEMNGQVVDVDKPFRLVGRDGRVYRPMYPGDPVLPAAEAINCGCTVVEVFEVMEGAAAEIAAEVGA